MHILKKLRVSRFAPLDFARDKNADSEGFVKVTAEERSLVRDASSGQTFFAECLNAEFEIGE